jgi:16S rRNA (uracil1498-N3)-methyltransferase
MPQNRYYYQGLLQPGHDIFLKDDEFHYLRSVMRTRAGEKVDVINGKGLLATAEVSKISEKDAILSITSVEDLQVEPRKLQLALGFLKPAHLEYAVEKACEVGVTGFLLFAANRSEKKAVSDQYLKRLQTIILSATKQCGRLFLPELHIKDSLKDCLEGQVLFGDLASTTHITDLPLSDTVTLVIGPESGLSSSELKLLIDNNAQGVLLHKNTLRAETAAALGIALLELMR